MGRAGITWLSSTTRPWTMPAGDYSAIVTARIWILSSGEVCYGRPSINALIRAGRSGSGVRNVTISSAFG
jgi:hypothetical protein